MNYKIVMGSLLLAFSLSGCSSSPTDPMPSAPHASNEAQNVHEAHESIVVSEATATRTAALINAQGKEIGSAVLNEEKGGVTLTVEIKNGLTPGKHGFHIHEKAFTGTDFKTAGEHFNPTNKEHGLKNPRGWHIGDMHNLQVNPEGTAKQTEIIEGASLKEGHPNSLLGRSIIIHTGVDDQMTNPAGNSGDRVAGGVIPK